MPTVDLVYDSDCPNVIKARSNLLRAFTKAGITPTWSEHRIGDPEVPARVRGYGSPTILIGGRDVAGLEPSAEACCRIYAGNSGVPTVELIASALSASAGPVRSSNSSGGGWRAAIAVLPGIGVAALPKVACPACWPAYAGVLTSLGLGFLMDNTWLLPLTSVFLLIAVGALGYRAKRRRGFAPFVLGLFASLTVMLGKFSFDSDPAMYAGLGMLVVASLWNTWPKRARAACPACPTTS